MATLRKTYTMRVQGFKPCKVQLVNQFPERLGICWLDSKFTAVKERMIGAGLLTCIYTQFPEIVNLFLSFDIRISFSRLVDFCHDLMAIIRHCCFFVFFICDSIIFITIVYILIHASVLSVCKADEPGKKYFTALLLVSKCILILPAFGYFQYCVKRKL